MGKKMSAGTAEQFIAELANNQKYQSELQEKEKRRLAKVAEFQREEAGLVAELVASGIHVILDEIPGEDRYDGPPRSVSDLVSTTSSYSQAIPILLKHLQLDYSPSLKQAIVRALITPDAVGCASVFILMFEAETELELKWLIGAAIAESATENDAEKIAQLANDITHGQARSFLPLGLVCRKQDALPTLKNWRNDPILGENSKKAIKLIRKSAYTPPS